MRSAWRKAVEARLSDREDLGLEGLCRFWSGLPEKEVLAALALIEQELDIRPGLLRPEDRLHDLFRPPPTKNPLRWLEFQMRSSDGLLELSSELNKRLKAHGTVAEWGDKVYTLDEFVHAWCGAPRPPSIADE